MRLFYFLALLSFIPLAAAPAGSAHDAWSDWILDAHVIDDEDDDGEELSENEQESEEVTYK